jgi:hypothetical protein
MTIAKYFLASLSFLVLISCGNDSSKIKVDKADVMDSLRAKEDYVVATTTDGDQMKILFMKGYGLPDSYVRQNSSGNRLIMMSMDKGVRRNEIMTSMEVNCQSKEYRSTLSRDSEWKKVTADRSLVAYGVTYACELPAREQ